MADKDSKDQAPEEAGGGAAKGVMKWLVIGIAFFAIATVSPIVSHKIFGSPGGGDAAQGEAGGKAKDKGPPQYYAIEPSLVVSVADGHVMRFLQIEAQLMTRDADAISAVQVHNPLIRNNLLMLMSSQDLGALKTREGKEALRQLALAEVQKILTEQTGDPGIEDLYFTGFVIQ